jgi:hypothetical protein
MAWSKPQLDDFGSEAQAARSGTVQCGSSFWREVVKWASVGTGLLQNAPSSAPNRGALSHSFDLREIPWASCAVMGPQISWA